MGEHKIAQKRKVEWTRGNDSLKTRPVLCAKCNRPLGWKGDYPAINVSKTPHVSLRHSMCLGGLRKR